jgi:DNA-binding XRE family transcriptional regulator
MSHNTARQRAHLTQENVTQRIDTQKSVIVRLEEVSGEGKQHSPSATTLLKYAKAVGCDLKIRLVPKKAN